MSSPASVKKHPIHSMVSRFSDRTLGVCAGMRRGARSRLLCGMANRWHILRRGWNRRRTTGGGPRCDRVLLDP